MLPKAPSSGGRAGTMLGVLLSCDALATPIPTSVGTSTTNKPSMVPSNPPRRQFVHEIAWKEERALAKRLIKIMLWQSQWCSVWPASYDAVRSIFINGAPGGMRATALRDARLLLISDLPAS